MGMLIDKGISQGERSSMTKLGMLLIDMACLSLLLGCLGGSAVFTATTGFSTNISGDWGDLVVNAN